MARPRSTNPRSELIALRVTPRTRYGLQLLAQQSRCSLSEAVLSAVEDKFGSGAEGLVHVASGERAPTNVLDRTWSPVEYERVIRTGLLFPNFLTEAERYLWLVIRETPAYWKKGRTGGRQTAGEVNWEAVAVDWPELKRRSLQQAT